MASGRIVLFFPFNFPLLMREYYSAANNPGSYFLGRTIASIPALNVQLFMSIITYIMTGMSREWEAIGYFCAVIGLFLFSAESCGYLASSFSKNPIVAMWISKWTVFAYLDYP